MLVYYGPDLARWFLKAVPHSGENAFDKSAGFLEE